ncbi:STAS/SEC14 domain-containing protein [Fusobacterium sp. MFO224]|uniref:STAS/SEC14 domain-containing protein n=1 Tax=Fusobacterium sp. MFO224 TaxID=3378070 RepID=UPI003852D3CD
MIEVLSRSNNANLGIRAIGRITLDEELTFLEKLNSILIKSEKVNILVMIEKNITWDTEAELEDLKWIVQNFDKINKVALVSDEEIAEIFFKQMQPLFELANISRNKFGANKINEAWNWLES